MSKKMIRTSEDCPQKGELWMGVPFGPWVDGVKATDVGELEETCWDTDDKGEVTTYKITFRRYEPKQSGLPRNDMASR